jgi:putative NIF3 family GTP cyclohydrolase 1 type 2
MSSHSPVQAIAASEQPVQTGHELFAAIQAGLGAEARRHWGVDPPARRDTAIAGGSYRAIGSLVDGFRAGDADTAVAGIVVAARASTAVLQRAVEIGANFVISRTAFLGDSQDRPVGRPEPALAAKIDYINEHRLVVLRLQDPREGPAGRQITTALPRALGLTVPLETRDSAAGMIYPAIKVPVIELVRKIKAELPTQTVRLVGDPAMLADGVAFATETNRPNALAPLISRPDVNLLICGEVHETETTAYVMDAIALGQNKALLIAGSIAIEEPAARELAAWLLSVTAAPVAYVESREGLLEVR